MVCPTLISLDQFTHYQSSQVGLRALNFGKLFIEGIPLPEMFCIPHETLLLLIRENKLDAKLDKLLDNYSKDDATSRHQLKVALMTEIRNQQIPGWFAQEIISVYHRVFHQSFLRFIPGELLPNFDETKFEHIHGDANVIESLLECWAEIIAARLSQHLHTHSLILAPISILLQAQYQPLVSGKAFTQNVDGGSKTQVTLFCTWGGPDKDLLENQADHFLVDVRTWQVVQRTIATKSKQYHRIPDKREVAAVPLQYHQHPSLTDEQASSIAQVAFAIKQHRFAQQVMHWELSKEGLFVTDVEELTSSIGNTPHSIKKTITKLLVSTGNPYKQAHLSPLIDGVGVLRSEYTLAKFGIHPEHVIRSKQKHVLQKELVKTIAAYQEILPGKPLLYRSQNFNSAELGQLKFSENFEPKEANPYLGYRGGMQLIRQPELLQFELEVLYHALKTSRTNLGYLLSFIRTPGELEFILHQISKIGLFTFPQFSVWLQLNTPDNILNLSSYPTQKLAGVSLNVKSVQSLLLGIDPDNNEVYEHYILETQSTLDCMERLAQTVQDMQSTRNTSTPLQLHLHLEDYSHELVATAVKLGYHGVVVKPTAAQIAHDCILDTEQSRLMQLS